MADEGKMHLSFLVDGEDFSSAGSASSSVKKILKQLGVSPDVVRRFAIALYEAEINVVIHGGGGSMEIDISPTEILAVLTDHGKGIADIDLAMQEGYSTATEEIRALGFGAGMGLPNMKKYTDEMQVDSKVGEGTTVILKNYF